MMKFILKFLQRQPTCPNCDQKLPTKPIRKQACPHCGKFIFARNGALVTHDEAMIIDWLARLEIFGIARKDFDIYMSDPSKQFGSQASVTDTLWRILNQLVRRSARDAHMLEQVYREMAGLASSEGRDPTAFLIEAERIRGRRLNISATSPERIALGDDELKYVRQLRKNGNLEKAEELLLKAYPSPAVLDELRKIASARAKIARKNKDWQAVVQHLEGYTDYATQWWDYCLQTVNQEPPLHTESDLKLLREARARLAGSVDT